MDEVMDVLSEIGEWYVDEKIACIMINGETNPAHVLPKFVLDRLVIREITYQMILHGFNALLSKDHKECCPTYPLYIGMYGLSNSKFAKMEANVI
jgi:hypothetical protein